MVIDERFGDALSGTEIATAATGQQSDQSKQIERCGDGFHLARRPTCAVSQSTASVKACCIVTGLDRRWSVPFKINSFFLPEMHAFSSSASSTGTTSSLSP